MAATTPIITQVAPPSATGLSFANGLNTEGRVVGQVDNTFPFQWVPSAPNATTGAAANLPTQFIGGGPGEGSALSLNDNDDVVGWEQALDASGTVLRRAIIWSGGIPVNLGTLIPDPNAPGMFLGESRATDVNAFGVVVGDSDSPAGVQRAFALDQSTGALVDLGSLIPDGASRAWGINDQGDIVGVSDGLDPNGAVVDRAFLLPAGSTTMIDLGTLTPDPNTPGAFLGASGAFGINGNGTIVGNADSPAGQVEAALFSSGGAATSLLGSESRGYDLGPSDEVVGVFGPNGDQGYLLSSGGGFNDLSAFTGMTITSAAGVNAAGQVCGTANVGGLDTAVLIS